jgi:Arc/MetJ family transcription regulator
MLITPDDDATRCGAQPEVIVATKKRLSVAVDPELLEEAIRVTGSRSQREAVETALAEVVRRHRLERMAARSGSVELTITLDELLEARASG